MRLYRETLVLSTQAETPKRMTAHIKTGDWAATPIPIPPQALVCSRGDTEADDSAMHRSGGSTKAAASYIRHINVRKVHRPRARSATVTAMRCTQITEQRLSQARENVG